MMRKAIALPLSYPTVTDFPFDQDAPFACHFERSTMRRESGAFRRMGIQRLDRHFLPL